MTSTFSIFLFVFIRPDSEFRTTAKAERSVMSGVRALYFGQLDIANTGSILTQPLNENDCRCTFIPGMLWFERRCSGTRMTRDCIFVCAPLAYDIRLCGSSRRPDRLSRFRFSLVTATDHGGARSPSESMSALDQRRSSEANISRFMSTRPGEAPPAHSIARGPCHRRNGRASRSTSVRRGNAILHCKIQSDPKAILAT